MCWGGDSKLGNLVPPQGAFAVVHAFFEDACAMDATGALSCWGAFPDSQGTFTGAPLEPPGKFKTFAVGHEFGCGILQSGELACWGLNDEGQASPP